MAKQLQLRRGTTLQNNAFIGAVGEPTLDTETGMIHIHDGVTQGGKEFIDAVVAFQKPTAENGYTWYRKYASGWVEQGGWHEGNLIVSFPIAMANTNYFTMINSIYNNSGNAPYSDLGYIARKTTTGMTKGGNAATFTWQVSGMAA